MKTPAGVIPLFAITVLFSCSTIKHRIAEKNRELIRFIETEITTDKNAYNTGEPIVLSMKATNTGRKKYTFLPWGTPIENTLTGDCLMVKQNHQLIEYIGIMVKRVPSTKKDYVTLKHHEFISGEINILEGYP